jgi:hypothetical protein
MLKWKPYCDHTEAFIWTWGRVELGWRSNGMMLVKAALYRLAVLLLEVNL